MRAPLGGKKVTGMGRILPFSGPHVHHQSGPNLRPLLVSHFTLIWGYRGVLGFSPDITQRIVTIVRGVISKFSSFLTSALTF